jgi:hypothetical protein
MISYKQYLLPDNEMVGKKNLMRIAFFKHPNEFFFPEILTGDTTTATGGRF